MFIIDGVEYLDGREVCQRVVAKYPHCMIRTASLSTYVRRGRLPQPKIKMFRRNYYDPDEVDAAIAKMYDKC